MKILYKVTKRLRCYFFDQLWYGTVAKPITTVTEL